MIGVIGLNGSPFSDGTCGVVLKRALAGAERAGAKVEYVHLQDFVCEPFRGARHRLDVRIKGVYESIPEGLRDLVPDMFKRSALERIVPEVTRPLLRRIEHADGIIVATPSWWSSPSDVVKILLNYLTLYDYRDFALQGKVAGLIAICEEDGAQHANMLMQNALTHMGFVVPPFCSFFYHRKMVGGSEDDWQETDQELVGVNVVRMIRLLKGDIRGAGCDWRKV